MSEVYFDRRLVSVMAFSKRKCSEEGALCCKHVERVFGVQLLWSRMSPENETDPRSQAQQ